MQRRMVAVAPADPEEATISVASYNVLSAKKVQVKRANYSHCVPHVLNFAIRKNLMLNELKDADSDICCLQSADHFHDWWQPQLSLLGYDGVFTARTGGVPGEGVAVFFKRRLFQLFKSQFIDFNSADEQLLSAAEKIRRKKQSSNIPNNVGMIVGLQPWEKSKHPSAILVGNVELDDGLDGASMLKRNNQALHFFHEIERFNAELHLPLIVCGTFNCTPGDATYQIITTGRIPYTKQLPAPPTAPVASTPSSSSVIVRWSAPDNLGDYPVIGYRLVRRAGGSEKMGFGKDIIVDENTFKAVVTGLSSGTTYEFRVAAVTNQGTSPLSPISAPISTLANRKNPPLFRNLRKNLSSSSKGSVQPDTLRLPSIGDPNIVGTPKNTQEDDGQGSGARTGLTPRFEDHDVISDTALSFDHTHPKGNAVSHGSESSTIASDTTSGTLQSTGGATSNSAIADAQQRTQAAKAGENLPYGDLPMGERFDNAVHSLNLVTSYNDDALPAFKDSTDKRSVYTYRGRDISNRADYVLFSARRLRVVEVLDLPDAKTFCSPDPRVRSHIPDPSKRKPADWDDQEFITVRNHKTGVSEEVLNPNFCGIWEAPLIRNPNAQHDRLPTKEVRQLCCLSS
eukprot:INCI5387.4.p1 GENE.INCI5387.4~~INCI5387.4.p1  ORF type:complete len:625 (-),score=86.74 INCI5387.4:80-1954(-)